MRLIEMLEDVDMVNYKTRVFHIAKEKEKRPEIFNEHGQIKPEIFEEEIRPHNFIYVNKDKSSITFQLQDSSKGNVNGVGVGDLIALAGTLLNKLNKVSRTGGKDVAVQALLLALTALASDYKVQEKIVEHK